MLLSQLTLSLQRGDGLRQGVLHVRGVSSTTTVGRSGIGGFLRVIRGGMKSGSDVVPGSGGVVSSLSCCDNSLAIAVLFVEDY